MKPPVKTARAEAEQIDDLVGKLKRNFAVDAADIRIVKAPLRISPLGAHIDHQLGLVTGMTIDQAVLMAFAPHAKRRVEIESLNFEQAVAFDLDSVPAYQKGDWGNYIRGAVLALQQKHQLKRGLAGVVGGDMPIGGLSSSAAVTIAYLLALETVNQLSVLPEENISLVRFTENQYIGLNNGILDQSVILFSKPEHLTLIDPQSLKIENIPSGIKRDDFDVLVVYSGVTHVLVGTDYNNRVAECQEAAQLLLNYAGKAAKDNPRLRHIAPNLFAAEGHRLPFPLKKRATHYFGEMQRVSDGVLAWQDGKLLRFARLMNESGESSIKYYESGSPQLITLYEILRDTPGVYGTRFSGAGFRGSCIALIAPSARESIAQAIHRRYPTKHLHRVDSYSIHFCKPDGQAQIVKSNE